MAWRDRVRSLLGSAASDDGDAEGVSAAAIYPLLLDPAAWIHRRVESVEFVDDRLVRRRVSFDFTVPTTLGHDAFVDTSRLLYLPLTLLAKRPLRNFDLDGADDQPIPMLTKAQNEVPVIESLTAVAETVAGIALPSEARARLSDVVTDSPSLANAEIDSWAGLTRRDGTEGAIWKALVADEPFMDYATSLAESFVLLADVRPRPGVRQIVKLAYDEQPASEDRFLAGLASSFGWRRMSFAFEAAVARSASYHFEIAAPTDLEIACARLEIDPAVPSPTVDMAPGSRAHLYLAGVEHGSQAAVIVDIRARRSGLLRAALFVGVISFLLLLGGYFRLDEVASPDQAQPATGLLLLIPTFLAAYIVRPGEHQLATTLFVGVRALVVLAALAAVFAAALLAAGLASYKYFDDLWLVAAMASGASTAGLIISYMRPFSTSLPK